MRDKERFSTTDLFQFIARILSFSFKGADVKQFESEDIVGEEDLAWPKSLKKVSIAKALLYRLN